jgi:hypothetical protein
MSVPASSSLDSIQQETKKAREEDREICHEILNVVRL